MCKECSSLDLWELPRVWTPEQLYLAVQSIRDLEKLKAKIHKDMTKEKPKEKARPLSAFPHLKVKKHYVKEAV